jgi:hypothetical protein
LLRSIDVDNVEVMILSSLRLLPAVALLTLVACGGGGDDDDDDDTPEIDASGIDADSSALPDSVHCGSTAHAPDCDTSTHLCALPGAGILGECVELSSLPGCEEDRTCASCADGCPDDAPNCTDGDPGIVLCME